jgi:hypothetical protein
MEKGFSDRPNVFGEAYRHSRRAAMVLQTEKESIHRVVALSRSMVEVLGLV